MDIFASEGDTEDSFPFSPQPSRFCSVIEQIESKYCGQKNLGYAQDDFIDDSEIVCSPFLLAVDVLMSASLFLLQIFNCYVSLCFSRSVS